MNDKLIIFLVGVKVRKYDLERFDANEIENSKKMNFEFHELADLINPGFSNVFTADRIKNNKIKVFANFENWKLEIIKKKEIYNNLIVYNDIEITNFESFKINYFLYKNRIKTLIASNLDHPNYSSGGYIYKFKWLFRNLFFNNKKIRFFIKHLFFSSLGKILKIQPTFFLKCGSSPSKYDNMNSIKILNGHSRDYNMHIKSKKEFFTRDEKFGIYLESASPVYNLGDALIAGDEKNVRGTSEKWLKSINNFFLLLEKKLKIKIMIMPHPKIKHYDRYSKFYSGREVIKEKLSVVAKKSELIIARDSTGFSYGAIYKKPIIFMNNNELSGLKNNFINNQIKFAKELGKIPINIDKDFTNEEVLQFTNFDEKYYENYIKKYLTARSDEKLNYQVFEDAFNL